MASRRLLGLLLAFAALLGAGHGDDSDDLNLEDALLDIVTKRPTPKGPKKPSGGTGFDLDDYFDTLPETTTQPPKPAPKPFPRPGKPDNSWDVIHSTTTKQPKTTRAPPKHNPGKDPMDLDLADALDDKNDGKDGGRSNVKPGEAFSDSDLADIVDGGYSPDKKKGDGGNTDNNYGGTAVETGTIAGIASGLAMALIGAVSSYISYQQKKFCFSIQQGLNAEYVKGENMEAVVSEEPQDVHKSMGLDGIHRRVLKELAAVLTKPLPMIGQQSWLTGQVPADWRLGNVAAIDEKSRKDDPGYYRHVSLTLMPGKDNKVTHLVDEGSAMDIVYLDFSKTFDIVYLHCC